MDSGFLTWSKFLDLNLNLDLNIWIWILKSSKLLLPKKWIWIKNRIQFFGSKIDINWIIKNSVHDRTYT